MNTIYLLSLDGHRDSVSYNWFATDELGIKQMIFSYHKEYFSEIIDIDSFEIDLEKLRVKFRAEMEYKAEWDDYTYHLFKINKI